MTDDFAYFAKTICQGHPGVLMGLLDASRRVPELAVMDVVLKLEKRGQELYNHYGIWLRTDDVRFAANPTFSDYLVQLVDESIALHNLSLDELMKLAGKVVMTEAQKEEQRRDWVYGNTKLSNPNITRELVNEVADKMEEQRHGKS